MKIGQNKLVEVIGLSAVVISLIFVAFEIRQSNKIAVATMEYEVRDNFTSLNELEMTDTEFAEVMLKLQDPDFVPANTDLIKSTAFTGRLINIWIATTEAYENGMVSEETYLTIVRDDIRYTIFNYPGLNNLWEQMFSNYPAAAEMPSFRFLRQYLDEYAKLGS